MSYQCQIDGSCRKTNVPVQGAHIYSEATCNNACQKYYHCNAGNCVQETAHLDPRRMYYPDDPTCNAACHMPSPAWIGYYPADSPFGVYSRPFPRWHRGWRRRW